MSKQVIIVDIDGTIALHDPEVRNPYDTDFDKVIHDSPNKAVIKIIESLFNNGCNIIYVSGRSDEAEEVTREWLRLFSPPYVELHMRKRNDFRKDFEVKREIYEAQIANRFDVLCVFDDRQQVVDMWREVGLVCLQVAAGDF
jgi:hypothetical protein